MVLQYGILSFPKELQDPPRCSLESEQRRLIFHFWRPGGEIYNREQRRSDDCWDSGNGSFLHAGSQQRCAVPQDPTPIAFNANGTHESKAWDE